MKGYFNETENSGPVERPSKEYSFTRHGPWTVPHGGLFLVSRTELDFLRLIRSTGLFNYRRVHRPVVQLSARPPS